MLDIELYVDVPKKPTDVVTFTAQQFIDLHFRKVAPLLADMGKAQLRCHIFFSTPFHLFEHLNS